MNQQRFGHCLCWIRNPRVFWGPGLLMTLTIPVIVGWSRLGILRYMQSVPRGGFELFGSSSNCGSLLPGMGGSAISSSRSGGLATGRGGGSSSSNAVRSHKPGMNCIFFRRRGGEFEFGFEVRMGRGGQFRFNFSSKSQVGKELHFLPPEGGSSSRSGGLATGRGGGGQFEFEFSSKSQVGKELHFFSPLQFEFGFASPPVLVKLGFNSGSTNLKNKTCESISQKKILNRPLCSVHFFALRARRLFMLRRHSIWWCGNLP